MRGTSLISMSSAHITSGTGGISLDQGLLTQPVPEPSRNVPLKNKTRRICKLKDNSLTSGGV